MSLTATMDPGQLYVNEITTNSIEVVWGAVLDVSFDTYLLYLLDTDGDQIAIQQQDKTESRKYLI